MTALAEDRPQPKKPPRLGLVIATILELGIAATLVVHHSLFGLLLCVGYGWFSATRAFFGS